MEIFQTDDVLLHLVELFFLILGGTSVGAWVLNVVTQYGDTASRTLNAVVAAANKAALNEPKSEVLHD